MSVDEYNNTISFSCDGCSESFEGTENDTFQEVWENAKVEGWRAFKVGDDWCHHCPVCVKEK